MGASRMMLGTGGAGPPPPRAGAATEGAPYVIGLMAAIWCALAIPDQAQAEKRVALVIGNAACRAVSELPNRENPLKPSAVLAWRSFATRSSTPGRNNCGMEGPETWILEQAA